MSLDIAAEQTALEAMATGELVERYAEVCGERTRSRNRIYLIRRILWRMQANVYGGLSARALERAEELARDSDVRVTAPRPRPRNSQNARLGPRTGHQSQSFESERPTSPLLRLRAVPPSSPMTDPRLPRVGSTLSRRYRNRDLLVTIRDDGIEYDGQLYGSLSAVAKAITGSHCNGFRWFGLTGANGARS